MVHRFPLPCSCLIPLVFVAIAGAEDWPEFRGPTGQGLSSATGVPVKWDTRHNVAWKREIPGQGWSSPVVVGGRVYLTTAVGPVGGALSLHALCVDARE